MKNEDTVPEPFSVLSSQFFILRSIQKFLDKRHDVLGVGEVFTLLRVVVVEAFGDFSIGAKDVHGRNRSGSLNRYSQACNSH